MKRVLRKSVLAIILIFSLFIVNGCNDQIDTIKNESTAIVTEGKDGLKTDINTDSVVSTGTNEVESTVVTETTDATDFVSVKTEFYTLSVPYDWYDKCSYEEYTNEYVRHTLSFYHKDSKDAGVYGDLFHISLLNLDDDYTRYPHEVLGSVSVYRIGQFNVVVRYPSDVRFTEETMLEYKKMREEVIDILNTIEFNEECEFSEEPLAIITEPIATKPVINKNFIGKWSDTGIGVAAPIGSVTWEIEFRGDGTGEFDFIYGYNDVETLNFSYTYFQPYNENVLDGVIIKADGAADISYLMKYTWSNELQNMLMTMYEVKYNGAPNLDVYWVFERIN
ncbi:MAG: hypothetical protein IJ451_04180 [Ruminococcus sp.]|nr:hypothetical protein [Ruminococcus sp.]